MNDVQLKVREEFFVSITFNLQHFYANLLIFLHRVSMKCFVYRESNEIKCCQQTSNYLKKASCNKIWTQFRDRSALVFITEVLVKEGWSSSKIDTSNDSVYQSLSLFGVVIESICLFYVQIDGITSQYIFCWLIVTLLKHC